MNYTYVKHDGAVLRRAQGASMLQVEIFLRGQWKPFPPAPDGDIRNSSIAAWAEGTPIDEATALKMTGGARQPA